MNDLTINTEAGHAPAVREGRALTVDPVMSIIERVALSPDADMDKFERMLAMKERIDQQNARIEFSQALADARAEIPTIIKDATVDFTSSKGRTHYRHETLAGIAKAIDPILSRYGLSYRFRTGQDGGRVIVTCIVSHAAGYSEETTLSGSPDQSGNKNGFQAVGSAVTYLQRYTLKAALGLSVEADDDAQAAASRPDDPPVRQTGQDSQAVAAESQPQSLTLDDQRTVSAAIDGILACESLADLSHLWAQQPRWIQYADGVSAAKDRRKAELSKPQVRDLGDDFVPF